MYSQKINIVKDDISKQMDDGNCHFHLCTFGCGSGKTTNFLYECADRIKDGKPFAYKDEQALNVAVFSANTVAALRSNMATIKKRLDSDDLFNKHVAILPGYQDIGRSFLKDNTKRIIKNINDCAKQAQKYDYQVIENFINRYTKNPYLKNDPILEVDSLNFNHDFHKLMTEINKLITVAMTLPKADQCIKDLMQTDFYNEATAVDAMLEKNHKKIVFLTHKKLTINLFKSFFGEVGRMSLVDTFVCIDEFELFHQTWVDGLNDLKDYDIHRVPQKIAATNPHYAGMKYNTKKYEEKFSVFYKDYLDPHLKKIDVSKNISIQSIQQDMENLHLLSFSNILTSNKYYKVSELCLVSDKDQQYDVVKSKDKTGLSVFDYLYTSLDLIDGYNKTVNQAVGSFLAENKNHKRTSEELTHDLYTNHHLNEVQPKYFRTHKQKNHFVDGYNFSSDFNRSGLKLISFIVNESKSPEGNATDFKNTNILISASGWFVDFVRDNKTIAMSATGKQQSIKNFNLNFIQDELGENFSTTSNQSLEKFKALNKRDFSDIDLSVNTIQLEQPSDHVLEKLCKKLDYTNHNELSTDLQEAYGSSWRFKATELLQLTTSVENFCKLTDHQHGLCLLNSCYVKKEKFVKRLQEIATKHNVVIDVLNAKNSKEKEPEILKNIKKGLRCLRIMNYSSGGAGSSMQAKLHKDYCKHIKKVGKKRHKYENEVDISYLFLQHYRNAIPNQKPKNAAERIQMSYLVADGHNRGIFPDPNKTYQNLFIYNPHNKSLHDEYRESADYYVNYAQKMEQAVGRIDRVNNKHKSIVIDICNEAENVLINCEFDHRSSSDVALMMLQEIKNKLPHHWINKQNSKLTEKLNESAQLHLSLLRQSRTSLENQQKYISTIKYLKENITTDKPKKEHEKHYIKNENFFYLEKPKHKYYAFDESVSHPHLSDHPVKEYRLDTIHNQKIMHRVSRGNFSKLDKLQTSNFNDGAYRICPHSNKLVFNMMLENLFQEYCAALDISYINSELPYQIHERADLIGVEGNVIIAIDIKNSERNRFEYFKSDKRKEEISSKKKEISSYYKHINKDKKFKLIYLILNTVACDNRAPIQEIYKETFYCDGFLLQNDSLNDELFSSLSNISAW